MSVSEEREERERRRRDGADDAWLERVRDAYAPEPMSPLEQRAFDARLEERLEVGRRRRARGLPLWQPALAAAVVAATCWLLWPAANESPIPTAEQLNARRRPASLADWEREVLDAAGTPAPAAGDAMLPDDYRAIAGMFLGGGSGGSESGGGHDR